MRSVACLLLGLMACSGKSDTASAGAGTGSSNPDDSGIDTDDPEDVLRGNCPVGMVEVAAMSGPLGEDDPVLAEQYIGQLVLEREMTVDAFCIDRYPFPGEGRAWTSDALDWSKVEAFEAYASGYGRRLCTVAELLAAAAGPENWRYPYDRLAYRDGKCEPADLTPSSRIGSYPDCESPTGVRDFMVRSAWALLDEQSGEDIRAFYATDTGSLIPGGGYYAVWGGSASQDTFFAPNNYGLHFYGPGDPGYVNESVRTCAALGRPSAEADEAWAAFVDDFASSGLGFGSLL